MKTVRLIRDQNGLNTSEDPLDVRQGSMLRARNVWVRRKGLVESRRGFEEVVDNASGLIGGKFGSVFFFNDQIYYHKNGALYEVSESEISQIASFQKATATNRLKHFEHRGVMYLLSAEGPLYLDEPNQPPSAVGVAEALDAPISCPPEGTVDEGTVPVDSQVGYSVVWKRVRGNRVLRGAPSIPSFCVNAYVQATWTQTGASETTIDLDGVQDFVGSLTAGQRIYFKTWVHDSAGTVPDLGDSDAVITGFTGSQVTISASGPTVSDTGTVEFAIQLAPVVKVYRPSNFVFGDVAEIYRTEPSTDALNRPTDEYYLVGELDFTDPADLERDFTDSISNGLGVPLYTNPSQGSGGQANHDVPVVTSAAFYRGHVFYGEPSWHEEVTFRFESLPVTDGTVTIAGETYTAGDDNSGTEFKIATESTTEVSIRVTAQNLVQQINEHSTTIRASYTSGEDGLAGQITVRRRALDGGGFTVDSSMVIDGGGVSERPGGSHEILISKYDEPESVNRLIGRVPVGSENEPVLGLAAVRDAVIVFKTDGVFGVYGESDRNTGASFEVREIDRTIRCLERGAIQALDNLAFAYTNQGFVAVNEYQVQIISNKIEKKVRDWIETADGAAIHSVAYNSEHFYIVWVDGSGWVYYTPTGEWTEGYARPFETAFCDQSGGGQLYAATAEGTILRERKTMTDTDFQDERVLLPSGAESPRAIDVEIIWADVAGRDASSLKRFSRASIEFLSDRASRHQVGFSTDVHPAIEYATEGYTTTYFPGDIGSSEPVVAPVPYEKQVGRRLRVAYRHTTPQEKVELSQVAVQLSEFKGIRSGSRGVPKRTFS